MKQIEVITQIKDYRGFEWDVNRFCKDKDVVSVSVSHVEQQGGKVFTAVIVYNAEKAKVYYV